MEDGCRTEAAVRRPHGTGHWSVPGTLHVVEHWSRQPENLKGSITVGKLADLVVLSRDIRGIPPPDLLKTEVHYTVVGGRIVYGDKP